MSPISVLLVERVGTIKELGIKDFKEADLYKKAGFKSPEGFICHATWTNVALGQKNYHVAVYGRTTGKANQENKYDFPPPVDSTLFFGTCILVNYKDEEKTQPANLTSDEWDGIYEHLFGGFEDLDSDDDEDEESEDDDLSRTKDGYVKDGFIVDSDDEDDSDYETESEESISEPVKKSRKAPTAAPAAPVAPVAKESKPTSVFKLEEPIAKVSVAKPQANYMDCTNELQEEEYL
jgi:hypothetical protein